MTFLDGKGMTHAEFIRFMRGLESEGNREYDRDRYAGQQLVRVADVYLTPETARELACSEE